MLWAEHRPSSPTEQFCGGRYNAWVQNKNDKRLQYKPVLELNREEVEETLRSGIPEEVSEALWSATYYDPEWRWVQSQCLLFLRHAELVIQTSAVICLGVLARF